MRLVIPEFVRFCIVGGIAFCVDFVVLELLTTIAFSASISRIISIAMAMQAAYLLHGIFTYRDHNGMTQRTWATFMASNLVGAAINYILFLIVLGMDLGPNPRGSRIMALAAGSGTALIFNYCMNRYFVFPSKDD